MLSNSTHKWNTTESPTETAQCIIPDNRCFDGWRIHVNIEFAANKKTNSGSETRVFLQHLWWLLLNDERTAHVYILYTQLIQLGVSTKHTAGSRPAEMNTVPVCRRATKWQS